MEDIEHTNRTCIVVVEVQSNRGKLQIGMVVDSVSEVLNIKAEELEDTPSFGTEVDTGYILGMAKKGDSVKILLDIDRVLGSDKMEALAAVLYYL